MPSRAQSALLHTELPLAGVKGQQLQQCRVQPPPRQMVNALVQLFRIPSWQGQLVVDTHHIKLLKNA